MVMKPWRWMLTLCVTAVLLGDVFGAAQAGPPTPRTSPRPPVPPPQASPDVKISSGSSRNVSSLSSLKAVLLVGPIDGDYSPLTTEEKQNMELAAAELEANGVTVYRFYTPNNDWDQIKAAAEGAHFLFYRGHGVHWSPMPHPTVGGFALKNHFVSADDVRDDLGLAPNAIVMLYGCFTAGSSSIDDTPIDSKEAQRRVAQYSAPFFDIGAGGYFANWYDDAFQIYVRYLFQGMTLGEAYEAYFDFNPATVERHSHPDHLDTAMWLDKDFWDGKREYNNAFVGLPDKTLADLFGLTAMNLSSRVINHLAQPSSPARTFTVQIDSTSPESFGWAVSTPPPGAGWLDVQPLSGTSGDHLTVVVTPGGQALGTYRVNIQVVADDPEVEDGDQTIQVTLRVLSQVYSTHLPMVTGSGP